MIVLDTETRLRYLRTSIVVAFLGGILFSHKLWFGAGRSFPRSPIASSLPDTFSLLEFLLSPLLLILLVFIAVRKKPTRFIVVTLTLLALLVFLDQTRLQPWVYQYSILLGILAFHGRSPSMTSTTLAACQLAVAAQYVWSGIQKLNWSFAHKIVPDILALTGISLPQSMLRLLPLLAIVVALAEASIGVALLFRRTRSVGVIVAVGMHLVLLLVMITSNRNSVIWPWNVAMIVIVGVLFWRAEGYSTRWLSRASYPLRAMLAIYCLAPVLSFAGWWDLYLSSALYSGNTPNVAVRINEEVRERLSPETRQLVFSSKAGELILPIYEWSMSDLNVPQYPEVRVYKELGRFVCRVGGNHPDIELIIQERPGIVDGAARVIRRSCRDLSQR